MVDGGKAMELVDFRKELLEEVRALASSDNDSKANTFVRVLCDYLINLDVIVDYELCFIKTEGKSRRILKMDAYSYDSLDKSLTLITSIYNDDDISVTLIRGEAKKNFDRIEYLLEEIIDGRLYDKFDISSAQYDFINEVSSLLKQIQRIRLIIITDSIMSDKIGVFETKTLRDIPIDYNIWDASRLYKTFVASDAREKLEINFKEYSTHGIPLLLANNSNNTYESYLGVIPGNVLADIYDKYGSKLLEGNVRSFLSTKGAVNRNIRKSILTTPEMFFAYNNGISATATGIELEQTDKGIFLIEAQDFQIVNGGQTTASLSTARFKDKANLDDIFVQMKLTKVKSEEGQNIIQSISRCSNSQNKVSEVDFFSTSQFHVRMEQISRRVYSPAVRGNQYDTHWFYERARGQYTQAQMKLTSAQKKKFTNQNPKSQVITKTDFAKYVNSWNSLPHIVSKGAQSNFLAFANDINPKWEENNELYNEAYFKEVVSLAILFKHVENLVSKQYWYQNAYRANIVTYSIALFSEKLKEQCIDQEIDFNKIWSKQEVPEAITEIFIKLTKAVFESITAPGKATANVTQWCKREDCWYTIKKTEIDIGKKIEEFLIDKNEKKKIVKESKKEQKFLNEIEEQVRIINLGEVYWQRVLKFGREKGLLGHEDEKVLQVVTKIRSSKIPSQSQCKELLKIVDRVEGEGFK